MHHTDTCKVTPHAIVYCASVMNSLINCVFELTFRHGITSSASNHLNSEWLFTCTFLQSSFPHVSQFYLGLAHLHFEGDVTWWSEEWVWLLIFFFYKNTCIGPRGMDWHGCYLEIIQASSKNILQIQMWWCTGTVRCPGGGTCIWSWISPA